MSNGSERIVPETTTVSSFSIEDPGKTERAKGRNCWQRILSAFCHCFENIRDCLDFWFCKNECCDFCCTCHDYYDVDDENERIGAAPALTRSEENWEAWSAKGIANDAVCTEHEVSSTEIHQVDFVGGDGDCKDSNNSEKHSEGLVENHSVDHQSSGGQNNDHGVCVIEGGGDADNQSGGHKESHSGDQQSSGGQHNDRRVCFSGGGGDEENHSGGHKESQSGDQEFSEVHHSDHGVREFGGGSDSEGHQCHHTNHGASDSGNDSAGHHISGNDQTDHGASYSGNDSVGHHHHTSGGDYGVSDFGGGGGSEGGGGWGFDA